MNKTILVLVFVLIFVLLSAFLPYPEYPEDNPDCGSDWIFLFHFENSPHCGGGDYYLFFCWPKIITKPSIFQAYCTSSITGYKLYQSYLPLLEK